MTDPSGELEYVAPPPGEAAPARPWWRRRVWQATAGVAAVVAIVFLALTWGLPLGRALEPLKNPTLVLVTADGVPFARRGSYKEAPVEAARLPRHVTGAFVAIEDRRFYSHWGVDLRSIARAMRRNVKAGEVEQGASTITQQLAKNAFLSSERSFRRKAQEAIIALYLEARLSKDEILSRYLSAVYFGDGVFGLRAAARHYFDKTPEQLSVGEAAMLAGLVKAPSRLAPTENFEGARARMRTVLAAMVETGVITSGQARGARDVQLRQGRSKLPVGTYFADWVTPEAKEAFEAAYGEVVVRTTLDSKLQAQAEKIVRRYLERDGTWLGASQAALVAMRPDGSVVAMVGGRDYGQSQFNRAADALRQPGSAFKLFVFMAALETGMNPDTLVLDAPVRVGDWEPGNHEDRFANRPVPLRSAFAYSYNSAAVRLAHQVGQPAVVRAARQLGITAPLGEDLSIALGTAPVTLLELTSAYAAVASGVAPVRAHGLATTPPGRTQRLSQRTREGLADMMRAVISKGTGMPAAVPATAFGKTGTTQDYRDAIFVGYVDNLVVGVWVGNDDNRPMNGVVGGGLPALIWRDFVASTLPRAARPPEPEALLEGELPLIEGAPTEGEGQPAEAAPEVLEPAEPEPPPPAEAPF